MLRRSYFLMFLLALTSCGGAAAQPVRVITTAPLVTSTTSSITLPPTTTTTAPAPTTTTTVKVKPAVQKAKVAPATTKPALPTVWDRIAYCETGGTMNWAIHTGNGYSGGLQMDTRFWSDYDGAQFADAPWLATREQQITVAERARDGYTNHDGTYERPRNYGPWPTCGRYA